MRSNVSPAGRSAIGDKACRLLLLELIDAPAGHFGETCGCAAVGDNWIVHESLSFDVGCFFS